MGHRDLLVTHNLSQPSGNHRSSPHAQRPPPGGFVQTVLSECGRFLPGAKSHIPISGLLGTYPTWDAAVWWRTTGSDVLLCDIHVQSRSSLGTNHPEGLTNAFRV